MPPGARHGVSSPTAVANEVLRFVVELLALAAFGYAAAQAADGPVGVGLGIVAVVIAAGFWGVLVAPRSTRRLRDPFRLLVEVVFFVAAGAALAGTGTRWPGLAIAVVGVANAVLLRTHQPVLGALE